MELEQTLEQEQEQQISKLTKKIERLEKDTHGKQDSLDKVGVVILVGKWLMAIHMNADSAATFAPFKV